MPKTKISEFSATPGNNTDIDGINIAEGCAPSGINDAIRELMAQLKDFQAGTAGDSFNGPVGTSTAAAGAFTTLSATGVATFSSGTAGAPAITTTGDTNTGLFFPAADTVAASVGGTEGLRLTTTGLGVGTSSPGSYGKLAIVSTGTSTTAALVSGSAASASNTISTDYWTGNSFGGLEKIATIGAINPNAGANNGGALYFSTSANGTATTPTERMRLDSSGNLGLGVTPSAWQSGRVAFQIQRASAGGGVSIHTAATTQAIFAANTYFNGTNDIYTSSGAASSYAQFNGAHSWYTAASGTAGNAISFTQAMTLDASGNLGVGTTSPSARLNIVGSSSTGYLTVGDGTSTMLMGAGAALSSDSSIPYLRSNNSIGFATGGGTERARITSGGYLLVGTTSGIVAQTGVTSTHNISTNVDTGYGLTVSNTSGAAFGLGIKYTAHSPNNAGNSFVWCSDGGGTQRASIYSNGGLANYSGNNVNLSDRREKTNFAPAKDYLDTICAIPVQTFNYIDQSEDDPGTTLGVVAQDVQAVAPELVMESNWGTKEDPKMRLSIYQTDLQYALMKALQELKAEFDAYKATHP